MLLSNLHSGHFICIMATALEPRPLATPAQLRVANALPTQAARHAWINAQFLPLPASLTHDHLHRFVYQFITNRGRLLRARPPHGNLAAEFRHPNDVTAVGTDWRSSQATLNLIHNHLGLFDCRSLNHRPEANRAGLLGLAMPPAVVPGFPDAFTQAIRDSCLPCVDFLSEGYHIDHRFPGITTDFMLYNRNGEALVGIAASDNISEEILVRLAQDIIPLQLWRPIQYMPLAINDSPLSIITAISNQALFAPRAAKGYRAILEREAQLPPGTAAVLGGPWVPPPSAFKLQTDFVSDPAYLWRACGIMDQRMMWTLHHCGVWTRQMPILTGVGSIWGNNLELWHALADAELLEHGSEYSIYQMWTALFGMPIPRFNAINLPSTTGVLPLMVAAEKGNTLMVNFLLNHLPAAAGVRPTIIGIAAWVAADGRNTIDFALSNNLDRADDTAEILNSLLRVWPVADASGYPQMEDRIDRVLTHIATEWGFIAPLKLAGLMGHEEERTLRTAALRNAATIIRHLMDHIPNKGAWFGGANYARLRATATALGHGAQSVIQRYQRGGHSTYTQRRSLRLARRRRRAQRGDI